MTKNSQFAFKTETKQLLDLMVNAVYSKKEIFLRELISNASDALDKLRFQSLTDDKLRPLAEDLHIRLTPDKENEALTISDNGIGMNKEDLIDFLGTIAKSGTKEFLKAIKSSQEDKSQFIGQFGLGFYSSFMVAKKVEVLTKKAGEEQAYLWTSEGGDSFSIEEAEKETNGTDIKLYLKSEPESKDEDDADSAETWIDFTDEYEIKSIVRRYSDFVAYPIKMKTTRTYPKTDEEGKVIKDTEPETVVDDETLNSMKAIWLKKESEVTDEEYKEFYRHISSDWMEPLKWFRFNVEGLTGSFSALLFLPKHQGLMAYMPDAPGGIQLYVKRVFIMEDCKELIPDYLNFVKGVVDSADMSLNISREILQEDRHIQVIRKTLTRKVLDTLYEMLTKENDLYNEFYKSFSRNLKIGITRDYENQEKLLRLGLFNTTKSVDEPTNLDSYIERMPEEQKEIYYLSGDSIETLKSSPHIEKAKEKGYEVLLLTDSFDEVWTTYVTNYKNHPMVSLAKTEIETGSEEDKKKREEEIKEKSAEMKDLLTALQENLKDSVREVKVSGKMLSSLACLNLSAHETSPRMEALMKAAGQKVEPTKRSLELNPEHPLMNNLLELYKKNPEDPRIKDFSNLIYAQAVLAEGGTLSNPSEVNKIVTDLMEKAIGE
ncbi:MAG: molecular chaperone HtpG [Candidatus Riflebacteria bacterium]|nr:molecular chaperone HtpG [Candidatus Riflebacteria bacterium]